LRADVFICVLALAGSLFVDGCDGCSCGRRKADVVEGGSVVAGRKAPSAARKEVPGDGIPERLDRLAAVASLVPAGVRWVAVFEPARVRDLLHKISMVAPKLTRARDYKDVRARFLELYGVDTDKLQGPCLLAGLATKGRVLVCAGIDKVVPPVEAALWNVADFRGPVVLRRDSRILLGVVDGRLVAGDENAVFSVVQHFVNRAPSLGDVFTRKSGIYRDLAAEDAWGGVALFFPGRFDPGWCPPDICTGTAIFSGPDRFLAVSISTGLDSTEKVRELMEQSWRDKVLVAWEAARANPRVPADYLRDGDRSVVENQIRVRSDRVIFEAGGDFLDVLSVVRMDDIEWLLGK